VGDDTPETITILVVEVFPFTVEVRIFVAVAYDIKFVVFVATVAISPTVAVADNDKGPLIVVVPLPRVALLACKLVKFKLLPVALPKELINQFILSTQLLPFHTSIDEVTVPGEREPEPPIRSVPHSNNLVVAL
jgi:hypothetical protein